jgi:transposase
VEMLYRETKEVRVKERAQAVLLAAGGDHSYEQIAQAAGRARSAIQRWIAAFENDGGGCVLFPAGPGRRQTQPDERCRGEGCL